MSLVKLLRTLNSDERDYIAGLDYGCNCERHRAALDAVIARGGDVDPETEGWYPYEVIELGKNVYHADHEREFVACAAIVLHNMLRGTDQSNTVEISLEPVLEVLPRLTPEHRALLDPMIEAAIDAGLA